MIVSFHYIIYFLGYLLLFNNNTYAKSDDDQHYLIYVNNFYGEVEIFSNPNSDSKLEKRNKAYIYVESLVDEIHSLIIENKDTYKNPEKIEEIENSNLSKRDDDGSSSNFDTSPIVYPISSIKNELVLYAYLSKYLVQKVKSIDNVKGCFPDTFKTVMHSNFNWNSISVQKNAPLHLSILSQDPKDYYYDDDYYYPSSAGKDIDVIIVDTDFYFNYKEFKNDNNCMTTCKAVLYSNGSIGENNSNINYSSCDVKDKNHGKSVSEIVGGVEKWFGKMF